MGLGRDPASESLAERLRLKPWASLGYRDYSLLWVSGLFAGTALQMRQIANLYQVYDISGSALQLGLTGLFQAIPLFTLGLFGGALADMMDRKKLLVITQLANLLLAIVLGVLTIAGVIQVWHIFAITSLTSAVNILGGPARMAFIPRLVPNSHLMNAVTFNIASNQSTFLFGPVLAGVLIDRVGMGNTYFANALLFIPSILTLFAIRTSGTPEGTRSNLSWRTLWGGADFIWKERIILALFLLDFGATIVGFYRPLLPIFAKDILHVGATGLGVLSAAPAVGSILGTGMLLLAGNVQRKGLLAIGVTLLFGISLGLFGASSWFLLSLLILGALGLADSISVIIRQTTIQILTPDHLRGRVASLLTIFAMGANSLGAMEAGFAASLLGAPGAMFLGSAVCVVIVLGIGAAWRQLREYRS